VSVPECSFASAHATAPFSSSSRTASAPRGTCSAHPCSNGPGLEVSGGWQLELGVLGLSGPLKDFGLAKMSGFARLLSK
jgi:hypothetical protein